MHPDSIELRWDPPKPDEINGNIVAYYINITHVESGESHSFHVGNTQLFSGSGFHPYYTYICTVFAVTVGPGPGSAINITTRETGKTLSLHFDLFSTNTCMQYTVNSFFFFVAPSAPPQNVMATALSSTSAKLFWLPPTSDQQNGIIREYSVIKVTLPSGHLEELTATEAEIVIDHLQPYTPYIFVVAAKTVALGPFSDQVKLEMPEESRHYMHTAICTY